MAQAPPSPSGPTPASTPLLQGFFRLTNVQKVVLLVGVAAAVAVAVAFVSWARTPDYKVLFSNVTDRDGGAIISALQQINVPYRMSEGGGAILVPSDRVYESRLRLAQQGLPRGLHKRRRVVHVGRYGGAGGLADADDGAEGSTCDCSVVREPVHWLRRRAARATRA